MMYSNKIQLILVVCLFFITTSLILKSQEKDQGGDILTPPGIIDNFLDLLMNTESICDPYYEHYDISPDGKWVVFSIRRSFGEDDIYKKGDLRKLPGGIPSTFLRQDIWIANTKTGKLNRVTNGKPNKTSFWHPVWSPNSKDLAFYGNKDGRIILWLCKNAIGKIQKFRP